jgi:pimeloyl-ACP methyl ester carboxylesterase
MSLMPLLFPRLACIVFFECVAAYLSPQKRFSSAKADEPIVRVADLQNGIFLHYVERGAGSSVVFVHGSLSDYDYWSDQIGFFSKQHRVVAYSRRYDYPNVNPSWPGYSAISDADDLANLIRVLHLGRVVLIGHSYGAFAGLFFAAKYPELLRALVLAEPPAIGLLRELPGQQATFGEAMFDDIERRMVSPMRRAFLNGETEIGVADFIDYVLNDRRAWDKLPSSSRMQTLRDAHEWEVMMTTGTLFPNLASETIRTIRLPVLLLSGAKSYPFLKAITEELGRLLPNSETVVLPNAGHQMWIQEPGICRKAVENFLANNGVR